MTNNCYEINPIGIVKSPYKEKFAVPRQPRLVEQIESYIVMNPPFDNEQCFRGLSDFSHIWLIFGFNQVINKSFRPMVRPPRLGGNTKVGVFATRSPFRPNNLGLSAVKFNGVYIKDNQFRVSFLGGDLVDGTPIYDIKPYINFSDSVSNAISGFAMEKPLKYEVEFSNLAKEQIGKKAPNQYPFLQQLIEDIISYDPRPAYKKKLTEDTNIYAVALYDFDIQFSFKENNKVLVVSVVDRV